MNNETHTNTGQAAAKANAGKKKAIGKRAVAVSNTGAASASNVGAPARAGVASASTAPVGVARAGAAPAGVCCSR